jgi:hypothetical protein
MVSIRWTFFNKIIGSGTVEHEEQLRDQVSRIEQLVLQQPATWQQNTSQYIAATKLNSHRIENLVNLTQMQAQSISSVYQAVQAEYAMLDDFERMWSSMQRKMADFIFLLIDIEALRIGLETMMGEILSPHLVPMSALRQALFQLDSHLQNTDSRYYIVHADAHLYYAHGKFIMTKKGNQLFILVDCPSSQLQQPLTLYQFISIPLSVPSNLGHYSLLSTDFYGILYHPASDFYAVVTDIDQLPLDSSDLWHTVFYTLQLLDVKIPTCP